MDGLLNEASKVLMENSILGTILVWYMWQNNKLVKELFTIIKNNTKALTEMKTLVSKCSKNGGK